MDCPFCGGEMKWYGEYDDGVALKACPTCEPWHWGSPDDDDDDTDEEFLADISEDW